MNKNGDIALFDKINGLFGLEVILPRLAIIIISEKPEIINEQNQQLFKQKIDQSLINVC